MTFLLVCAGLAIFAVGCALAILILVAAVLLNTAAEADLPGTHAFEVRCRALLLKANADGIRIMNEQRTKPPVPDSWPTSEN